jgi:hypothetical protein
LAIVLLSFESRAEVSVPPKLQGQLIARIASFDRNFKDRAGTSARVLLVQKEGDADSIRVVNAMLNVLRDVKEIGGLPQTVVVLSYRSASELAEIVAREKAAIVYLSLGLEGEANAISAALSGHHVLTIGATGIFADRGANVGFDLEGGRPRIVINLGTSRAQHVELKAELLKLAQIVGSF